MGLIFPQSFVNDIRRAVITGTPIQKRDKVRFPGHFVGEPKLTTSPGAQVVGRTTVPVWCSSCGGELVAGEPCIAFDYSLYPDLPKGEPGSEDLTSYIHPGKCPHTEYKP